MALTIQQGRNQRQNQKQNQTQRVNQEQIQARKLMAMPLDELRSEIEYQAGENPALERISQDDSLVEEIVETSLSSQDSQDDSQGEWPNDAARNHERIFDLASAGKEGLREHLLWQIGVEEYGDDEREVAEILTKTLDNDGFFTTSLKSLFKEDPSQLPLIEKILPSLQDLDPVGCYTFSVSEALLVQIKMDKRKGVAVPRGCEEFVQKFLSQKESLASDGNARTRAESLSIDRDEEEAIRLYLKELNPYPGRLYDNDEIHHVTPDLYVERQGSEILVHNNSTYLPVLRLSQSFLDLEKKSQEATGKKFIRDKIGEAKRFLNTIDFRNDTVLKVGRAIVHHQKNYFMTGELKSFEPMTLEMIAKKCGFSDSTISRATKGKYLQCEWGVIELKSLFSGNARFTQRSSQKKEEITITKKIIEKEIKAIAQEYTGKRKLSAQTICDQLNERGISIARRTVSKYLSEIDLKR